MRMMKIVTLPQVDLSNPLVLPSLQHPPASCINLQPKCWPFPPQIRNKGTPFFCETNSKKQHSFPQFQGGGFSCSCCSPLPPFSQKIILYYRMYRVGNRYFPLPPLHRLRRKGKNSEFQDFMPGNPLGKTLVRMSIFKSKYPRPQTNACCNAAPT